MELILVVALISILLGAITFSFVAGMRLWDVGLLRGGIKKEASYCLRVISQELRQASSITAAEQNAITFAADLDQDGVSESITYSWSGVAGENLNRTEAAASAVLARDVQGAWFNYYDASNNQLPFPVTASSVRLVEFSLQLKKKNEGIQCVSKVRPLGI